MPVFRQSGTPWCPPVLPHSRTWYIVGPRLRLWPPIYHILAVGQLGARTALVTDRPTTRTEQPKAVLSSLQAIGHPVVPSSATAQVGIRLDLGPRLRLWPQSNLILRRGTARRTCTPWLAMPVPGMPTRGTPRLPAWDVLTRGYTPQHRRSPVLNCALPPRARCPDAPLGGRWPPSFVHPLHLLPTSSQTALIHIQTPNQGDPLPKR